MTIYEYRQLKAFARLDALAVAAAWILSFGLYVAATARPELMLLSVAAALASPFVAGQRLASYRDTGLGGKISFRRAYLHALLTFAYATLLLALAQTAYFQWMDNGYLAREATAALSDPSIEKALADAGMADAARGALMALAKARPIDIALGYLPLNLMASVVLALPVAAWGKKK